jgi:hypothetical protein
MKLTPKQKAKELVDKYSVSDVKEAKSRVLDEIDDIIYEYKLDEKSQQMYSFWQEVKQELEKL